MAIYTYSFLDVNASIVGPNGAFAIGQSAGVDSKRLSFPGFDGNNETKFMTYA